MQEDVGGQAEVLQAESSAGAKRALRVAEMLAIYVTLPVGIWALAGTVNPLPILWVAGLVAFFALWFDPRFDRRVMKGFPEPAKNLTRAAMIALPAAGLMAVLLWTLRPEAIFRFPLERTGLWAFVVFLFYPVFSVIPQTILYRVLWFHRYDAAVGGGRRSLLIGAAVFGLGHIVFGHWVPVVLTFVGGLLMLWRFERTRSLWVSVLEHALLGGLAFTIGYGVYLYHGSVAAAAVAR